MTPATSGPMWRTPLAYYDREACCWRTSQGTFPWDSTPSSVTLPRWGMTRAGELYELPTPALLTGAPECSSSPMHEAIPRIGPAGHADGTTASSVLPMGSCAVAAVLPTPMSSLGRGTGMPSRATAHLRQNVQHKRNLDDAIALLPSRKTPEAWAEWTARRRLLETPRVTTSGMTASKAAVARGQHDSRLEAQAALLPTPTAMDSAASRGSSPSDVTLTDAVVRTSLGARTNPRFVAGSASSDDPPLDLLSLLDAVND
jgi:hypothetical protein